MVMVSLCVFDQGAGLARGRRLLFEQRVYGALRIPSDQLENNPAQP